MAETYLPYGSPQAVKAQSVALFAANMQRRTKLNQMTGKWPDASQANDRLRVQSSTDYPIVRAMDLAKTAGDEITFDLINPMGGKPIMGERMAVGRGEKLSWSQDKLRINQTRKPISAGGQMTQQRTPHDLRKLARSQAQGYMDRLVDQLALVHLSGARGFHNNVEWAVPVASDPDFAEIAVNPVKAPTNNRHFIATSTGIEKMGATAGEVNLLSTEVLNMDVVDELRNVMESMVLPPPPIKFEDDMMAGDSPLRVLMCSAEQYGSFVKSGNFRVLQAQAIARSQGAKNNPIFTGDAGLFNGILVIRMPKPIRFYKGDAIRYCADPYSENESTCVVPDSFGTQFAVDRAILLGGQALAEAWGKARQSGAPFFWNEEELDHKDKLEVMIGMIAGMSKIRFGIDYGGGAPGQLQPTDNGVVVLDTAVKIAGA